MILGGRTIPLYVGVLALLLNLLVVTVATLAMDRFGMSRLPDMTKDNEFLA